MKLQPNEITQSAWVNTKAFILMRIEKLRGELEKTTKTHDETLVVRGQIKALRQLLNIEKLGADANE